MTKEELRHFEQIAPEFEITNIRIAADLYNQQAIRHQREVIRLQREVIRLCGLAKSARKMADKLEGKRS